MILLTLCPASLMHTNSQRRKIIGRKDRSIDRSEDVFFVECLVRVISVAVNEAVG